MTAMAVHACGMVTCSGLSAEASAAAHRARIDNFQESRFISRDGVWVVGAEVPLPTPWRGLARHVQMLEGAVEECLLACPDVPEQAIALLICVAEEDRAGRIDGLDNELGRRLQQLMGRDLHPGSKIRAYGQVGGAVALQDARNLLAEGAQRVIVAGVDSFLNARTVRHLDEQDRLLTEENSNGFVIGEGAGAVLLGPPGPGGLSVLGLGFATEKAPLGSGEPLRADGLTEAYKKALAEANITMGGIDYRMADLSGEHYYFKEAALAVNRVLRERKIVFDIWNPVDCFGHTGAAVVPLMLGIALIAARKGYAPGPRVMVHATDDTGRRAAVVLGQEG